MPVCEVCKAKGVHRVLSSQRELDIHKKYFHDHGVVKDGQNMPGVQRQVSGSCPECGGTLFHEEGCVKCLCGYTKC